MNEETKTPRVDAFEEPLYSGDPDFGKCLELARQLETELQREREFSANEIDRLKKMLEVTFESGRNEILRLQNGILHERERAEKAEQASTDFFGKVEARYQEELKKKLDWLKACEDDDVNAFSDRSSEELAGVLHDMRHHIPAACHAVVNAAVDRLRSAHRSLQAEVAALRGALECAHPSKVWDIARQYYTAPLPSDPRPAREWHSRVCDAVDKALSSPPPPVVLKADADRLAEALNLVLVTTERWNESIQKVIGRVPQTGIETAEPYKALSEYRAKHAKEGE